MAILADKPQSWQKWMTTTWRPLMAVTYMATIWFDFIVGPVIFNLLQFRSGEQLISSWTPLTLQGGGLYHLAMGAVLGIAAWTRGQEKVASMNMPYPQDGQYNNTDYYNSNPNYYNPNMGNMGYDNNMQPNQPVQPGWINNNNRNNDQYYQPPQPGAPYQPQEQYQPPTTIDEMSTFNDDPHAYPNRPLRRQMQP